MISYQAFSIVSYYVLSLASVIIGIIYLFASTRLVKTANMPDSIAKYAFIGIGIFPIVLGLYLGITTYYFNKIENPIIIGDSIEVIAKVLE